MILKIIFLKYKNIILILFDKGKGSAISRVQVPTIWILEDVSSALHPWMCQISLDVASMMLILGHLSLPSDVHFPRMA